MKIKLLKKLKKQELLAFLLLFCTTFLVAQTTRNVSSYSELTSAISAASNGDIINFTTNIVIDNQIAISGKTLTFQGNGYEISVPRPGLDDMGRYNSSPSGFRVFQLSSGANVTLNDVTIKGGATSFGGAINAANGTTLRVNNSIISNSLSSGFTGGGGLAIYGTAYFKNSFIRRNAAGYGGGILVSGTARVYFEESTMVENRSTVSNGGGGAAECQSGSVLYFNNSTLSNNQSTEIGGAINNYRGTVYFINSSATGNVAFGNYSGGAIGNNGGNVYIVNSLFAHNYRRTTGSVTNPTGYVLDDFQPFSSPGGIQIYYSIYHAALPASLGVNTGNVQYTGASNGSNNSIFSGGLLSRITDTNGTEIGDQIYRPFLYDNQGSVAPTLQVGSFVSQSANRGVPTRFSNNNNVSPAIAYFAGGSWINLLGTSAAGHEVVQDQVSASRSASTPSRGAIESELNQVLYIVKVNGASGGTVNGGTIYGDVYQAGSSVTLTAIPNSGQQFVRWDYVSGDTGAASTSNPYTFTVSQNVTLVPVFSSLSAGSYTITYVGNGNTSGTVPAVGTYSGSTTIASAGSLAKDGFGFGGWNTNSNGSGTSYAAGASYIAGTNLTLYAIWLNTISPPTTSSSQVFCNGATVADLVATGTDLKWYDVVEGGSPLSSNASLSTGTYYVTQSISSLESNRVAVEVVTFPRLTWLSSISGDRNLTSEATEATYSVLPVSGATGYVWDLPPGMTIISSTGPSILVSVSSTFIGGNITVKAINGCSETLPVVLPITKQVLPLTISGSTVVCVSTGSVTESYSVLPVEGATSYVWTVPGGSLVTSGINTNSIEITYNTSFSRGTIRVSAIGSDGVISTGSLSVAGIELPGVITGSTQICTAGSYEYSIVAVEGATSYEWTLPMGMTLQGDGSGTTISVTTNGSVSGTLSVRALSPCGSSQLQTLSISGVSRPGYIYGERIICGATSNSVDTNGNINTTSQNGVYTYSIIPVTGADSYTWSLPTGVTLVSGQGTRVILVTFDSSFESGSITVVANSASCGTSPSRSVFVSSANASIGGPSNICGLTTATYSVAAGVGSNYVWTLPEGMSISSGAGTNSITVSINHPINFSNNNNTVSLSFTTPCGGSKEVSLTVDCPDYSNLTNCGSTVAFNERVYTRSVSGATMYAFDIYDSTSSTLLTTYETRGNFFQFVQALSSFEFGTTYNVKVRVKRNGVYGIAGSACSITLTTPVTAIQTSQCNQTVTTEDRVFATSVWNGVTYAFDIYDSEGNLITTLEKTSNFFRMREFASVYGMTYQVGVRVKRGNGSYGEQGSRCNVTIAIPTTSLVATQCGVTINIADRIYARSVANATMYAFSIYDANGAFITELERPFSFFRITDIAYTIGTSYKVGVKVKQGESSYGLEGALCTITLSGPPTTSIANAQCGATVLHTDAIYATAVTNATGYKFNVYDVTGTTLVASYESVTNSFSFSQLTGYAFDTTYQVRVQVIRGTEYGVEGTACSITVLKDAPARALSNQDEIKSSIISEFKAYPNPFTTTFSITPIEGETATLFYQVYDVTGKMMESRSVEANEITNHTIGEQYPAGVYLVIVRQGATTQTFKMVKQ